MSAPIFGFIKRSTRSSRHELTLVSQFLMFRWILWFWSVASHVQMNQVIQVIHTCCTGGLVKSNFLPGVLPCQLQSGPNREDFGLDRLGGPTEPGSENCATSTLVDWLGATPGWLDCPRYTVPKLPNQDFCSRFWHSQAHTILLRHTIHLWSIDVTCSVLPFVILQQRIKVLGFFGCTLMVLKHVRTNSCKVYNTIVCRLNDAHSIFPWFFGASKVKYKKTSCLQTHLHSWRTWC